MKEGVRGKWKFVPFIEEGGRWRSLERGREESKGQRKGVKAPDR